MDIVLRTIQEHATGTWVIAISIAMFFGSILLAWMFIVRIPADYLTESGSAQETRKRRHPVLTGIAWFFRNLFGLLLAISGFIMLFIPGQGILFIFLGMTLIDFPGKKRVIRKMIGWRDTLSVINRIRARAGKQPLVCPVQGE